MITEKLNKEVSIKSKKIVQDTVKKFTEKDIERITESCNKLRPLNNKINETRREFVTTFKEHHNTYRKVVNTYNEITLNTVQSGDTKKNILAYYIQLIRHQQEEQGFTKHLINEVKFGFMKSIVKWVDTPGELDKIAKTKQEDKKEIKKGTSFNSKQLSLELKDKKKTTKHWQIELILTNTSKYPLQNINISFFDDKNKKLQLIEASGENISLDDQKDMAFISFIIASMDENSHESLKYSIKGPLDENFENLKIIEVKIDNPVKKIKETQLFEVKK